MRLRLLAHIVMLHTCSHVNEVLCLFLDGRLLGVHFPPPVHNIPPAFLPARPPGSQAGDDEAARQQAALEAAARQLDPAAGGAAAHGDVAAAGADARHWTDFCKVLFSPRSLFTLPGYWAGPMEHSLVGGWGAAAELLGTGFGGSGGGGAMVEEAVDRVRLQGEACDSLAGVLASEIALRTHVRE